MKKPWAKWCSLGMGALFALVGVPILINESYKGIVGISQFGIRLMCFPMKEL